MVKINLIISLSAFATSLLAQPNNGRNSNLSNVFLNVAASNLNNKVQQVNYSNVIVQQVLIANKPKTTTVRSPRRRNLAVSSTPKPPKVSSQTATRRPSRSRRSSTPIATPAVLVTQINNNPVQVANSDNVTVSNVINTQEFIEELQQKQISINYFVPIQANEKKLNETNDSEDSYFSIRFPSYKKQQVYFSYADLSFSKKSFSLKKEMSKRTLKLSRKHKTKRPGKISRYITNNCCKWN